MSSDPKSCLSIDSLFYNKDLSTAFKHQMVG
jgi:hypothetical protein